MLKFRHKFLCFFWILFMICITYITVDNVIRKDLIGIIGNFTYWKRLVSRPYPPNYDLPVAYINELIKLSHIPRSIKKKTLLYIPKTNKTLWKWSNYRCDVVPFITPVFSGIAMLDGLPPPECVFWHTSDGRAVNSYGFGSYNYSAERDIALTSGIKDKKDLCESVKSKGYKFLVIINETSSYGMATEFISCV